MTLEQLRVFVAVAERQHVTRAAEALNLAQSAVSSAIAGLEARHEVKLFNRVGRGIELTQAGTLFLAEARAVLARAESAELVLSELGGLERGTLVVQASQTIASFWLPRHRSAGPIPASISGSPSATLPRSRQPSMRALPNLASSKVRWWIPCW